MLLFAGCERHRLFDNARNDASSFVNVGTAPPAFTYYLVVLGGNTGRTSIYDPETNTFSAGPILTGNVETGGHSFPVTSGPNTGKRIVVHGRVTGNTSLYDPSTQTFSAGPVLVGTVNWGGNSFEVTSGAYIGQQIVVLGSSTSSTNLYDPLMNSFSLGPPLSLGGGAYDGSLNFPISGDRTLVVHGRNSQETSIFDPTIPGFILGPTVPTAAVSGGSQVFPITGGTEVGKIMLMNGNGVWRYTIVDIVPQPPTFVPGLLGFAPPGPGTGSNNFRIPSGANAGDQVIIIGNGTATTAIFDQATNGFSLWAPLPGPAFQGSTSFYIADGLEAGKVLLIHGGDSNQTSIYDPAADTFSPGPPLSNNAGWGAHAFLLQ